MPTIVSTSQQLMQEIARLPSGGTIYLQPGEYGSVTIRDFSPTGVIRIESLNTDRPAHFDLLDVKASSNFTIASVSIGRALTPGEPNYLTFSNVENASHVTFDRVYVHGSLDANPVNDGQGISIVQSTDIEIIDSVFEELHRGIMVAFSSEIDLSENVIKNMSETGMVFAQVSDVEISGNIIENFSAIVPLGHPDAIQFMTAETRVSSRDISIHDNIILQGDGKAVQGIFMGDERGGLPYKNVSITNNFVFTDQYNGIVVENGENITIAQNSVLSKAGDNISNRIWLIDLKGGSIVDNVADLYIFDSNIDMTIGGNVDLSRSPAVAAMLRLSESATTNLSGLTLDGVGYQAPAAILPQLPSVTPAPAPAMTPVPALEPSVSPAPPATVAPTPETTIPEVPPVSTLAPTPEIIEPVPTPTSIAPPLPSIDPTVSPAVTPTPAAPSSTNEPASTPTPSQAVIPTPTPATIGSIHAPEPNQGVTDLPKPSVTIPAVTVIDAPSNSIASALGSSIKAWLGAHVASQKSQSVAAEVVSDTSSADAHTTNVSTSTAASAGNSATANMNSSTDAHGIDLSSYGSSLGQFEHFTAMG